MSRAFDRGGRSAIEPRDTRQFKRIGSGIAERCVSHGRRRAGSSRLRSGLTVTLAESARKDP
jgi:hypothetical protein